MTLFSSITNRFRKSEEQPRQRPGLNICILQSKLERYSSDRLNAAMQAAWHRAHDPSSFFGTNLDDEHGLIKAMGMFIPVLFEDRRLDDRELHGLTIPSWAKHTSFCRISFIPGGEGLPTAEARHEFTGAVALLSIELANDATNSFFFVEDAVFIAKDKLTKQAIFERKAFDPRSIALP